MLYLDFSSALYIPDIEPCSVSLTGWHFVSWQLNLSRPKQLLSVLREQVLVSLNQSINESLKKDKFYCPKKKKWKCPIVMVILYL